MLSKNGELIMKYQDIANIFNHYFGLVITNLNLFQWNEHNGKITRKMLKISVVSLSKNLSKTKSLSLLCM